ncbi:hypothetical protein [Halovivax limisalsi]|uniref:hypothetical protein n=1 Tax=Halovivax limisalsi TaxID=1453760 RepID=UPI001FFC9C2D|nr:hypothetical protein [Halovivax limisalsi]
MSDQRTSDPTNRPAESTDRGLDPTDRLADPSSLVSRADVTATTETVEHDDPDHCGTGHEGSAVVGVTNDDGETLVLIEDDHGIALLPHGRVEASDDWADAAHEGVEGQTGIAVALESVAAVRTVDHVVDGTENTTTRRVVYRASPAGGEIQACKRSAEAGSDGFRAAWVDELPADVEVPGGGPGNDLRLILKG